MHVRLALGVRRRRVTLLRRARPRALLLGLAVVCGILGDACVRDRAVAENLSVEWKMTSPKPIGAATVLGEIRLRDQASQPVRGARLQVEGFMSHPGMAPVMATVAERGEGVYEVELQLTMSGDWILLVTGRLPDRRSLNHRIDIANARPAG